jgi:hypothetical protein
MSRVNPDAHYSTTWRVSLETEPRVLACYGEPLMPCYVIRKLRLAHCKRGPDICEECRAMDVAKLCLLDVCPPRMGEIQRRIIKLQMHGEETWREFDIVRVFESEQEAAHFAAENQIEDVEW